AGTAALNHEIASLVQQLAEYERAGIFEGERSEEGFIIWEQDQVLRHQILQSQEALIELRKAFAIAAFHHWERSVQRHFAHESSNSAPNDRPRRSLRSYDRIKQEAINLGYPIDDNLDRVVTLINTLKHNNDEKGTHLHKVWPDIFPYEFKEPYRFTDWASSIEMADQQLTEVFDIISRSGPSPRGGGDLGR
ncbi:MAG TPA: hypothetical protein VGC14_05820, partial [Rhizobium sp.]